MNLNVIVPARGESARLPNLINKMSQADGVNLMFAFNGEPDGSIEIAKQEGVPFVTSEEGKTPATQAAIKELGPAALDGVVVFDADSYPLIPSLWARACREHLSQPESKTVCGPLLVSRDNGTPTAILRSVRALQETQKLSRQANPDHVHGASIAMKVSKEALQYYLDAPNIWPHDDHVLRDLAVELDGGHHHILTDPRLAVVTSARRMVSVRDRLRNGREWAANEFHRAHEAVAPPGSISYFDIRKEFIEDFHTMYS